VQSLPSWRLCPPPVSLSLVQCTCAAQQCEPAIAGHMLCVMHGHHDQGFRNVLCRPTSKLSAALFVQYSLLVLRLKVGRQNSCKVSSSLTTAAPTDTRTLLCLWCCCSVLASAAAHSGRPEHDHRAGCI
jgi:hypothetical protein